MPSVRLQDAKNANSGKKDRSLLLRLVRPMTPYLTWGLVRLGVRPIHVTYSHLVLSVIICLVCAFADSTGRVVAALLMVLWQILDATDGTLARTLKIRSNYGGFVDQTASTIVVGFVPICLGLGLLRSPEGSIDRLAEALGLGWNSWMAMFLFCGGLNSAAALFIRLIGKTVDLRFHRKDPARAPSVENPMTRSAFRRGVYYVLSNIERIGGFQVILLLLASVAGAVELFLVGYSMFYILMLPGYLVNQLYSLRHCHEY